MVSIRARQLTALLERAGPSYHSVQIRNDLVANTSLLREYPELAANAVSGFRFYLDGAPIDNVAPAIESLVLIAKHAPLARDAIAREVGPVLLEYATSPGEHNLQANELLRMLDAPVSGLHADLRALARSMVQLHERIVVVVGAGFSYDVMPITNELTPLLTTFLHRVGISDPVPAIRDELRLWEIVRSNKSTFCDLFAGRCGGVSPASQHLFLSELLRNGSVSHVISLNWDNLIERAYLTRYNEPIAKVVEEGQQIGVAGLWKLHGDVDTPGANWVFPYDSGRVFQGLLDSLNASLSERAPSHAVIVGYRELEPVVRDGVIRWLEQHVPSVIRIRPDWPHELPGGHAETSKRFFDKLQMLCGSMARS